MKKNQGGGAFVLPPRGTEGSASPPALSHCIQSAHLIRAKSSGGLATHERLGTCSLSRSGVPASARSVAWFAVYFGLTRQRASAQPSPPASPRET